jgi:hypothetical protein
MMAGLGYNEVLRKCPDATISAGFCDWDAKLLLRKSGLESSITLSNMVKD